jgi:hypothetical protein
MATKYSTPELRFVREFSDKDAFEAQARGYLSHVMVEFDGGRIYPIFFYDVVRLQQDLEESVKQGRRFIADAGMIVLEEITPESMKAAVEQLGREGFFDRLTPMTKDDVLSASPYQWPPPLPRKRMPGKAKSRGEGTRGKGVGTGL